MASNSPQKILIVCLGNICRSPTAEGVLRKCAAEAGLELEIDSAGTANYHAGSPPDHRAIRHAATRGYALQSLRARQIRASDFEKYDLILAADESNLRELRRQCPSAQASKLHLFLGDQALPDPYHGGAADFENVLDLVEERCLGLVRAWSSSGPKAG